MTFTFNRKYFLLFVIFFIIEVAIALFLRDKVIRPYFGDFLVTILLYFFLKSFIKISDIKAAILVLMFACFIEAMQALNFIGIIGLEEIKIASVVLGNHFDWVDILLYFFGIFSVLLSEALLKKRNSR